MFDHRQFDGIGLAELLHQGDISPLELLEAVIARAEAVNPTINAINYPMYDSARALAKHYKPQGLFAGQPFLVKDLSVNVQGTPTSCGSRLLANKIIDYDSVVVERYKAAGLIIFGKTNTPEFGLNWTTEPELFGATRSPWQLDYSAGGSSGGSAAAIASGIVPMASASDGGGSIRVPAACCGCFGLKPSRARISYAPDESDAWSGLSVLHAITRSVRDSAALLDVSHGYINGDPFSAPPVAESYLSIIKKPVKKLKIAFSSKMPAEGKLDPLCYQALQAALSLLSEQQHHVVEAHPQYDLDEMIASRFVITQAYTLQMLKQLEKLFEKPIDKSMVEPLTWDFAQRGQHLSAVDFVNALSVKHQITRMVAEFFQHYDLFVTPTLAIPGIPLGRLSYPNDGNVEAFYRQNSFHCVPFSMLANDTGFPAVSLPVIYPNNKPISVQIMANYGREDLLLQVSEQLIATTGSHLLPLADMALD